MIERALKRVVVLIVDDEPQIRDFLSSLVGDYFSHAKCELAILHAANAREAMRLLCQASQANLILTDGNMTGGDGNYLAEQMASLGMKNPIALYSADIELFRASFSKLNCVGLIKKPNIQEIQPVLERVFEMGQ